MKKILIVILLISLFINWYFLFFLKNDKKILINKVTKENIEKKVKNDNKNVNLQKNKEFSLKEVLDSKEEFNKKFSNIKEKYNLANLLINEFKKVKTDKDFLNYEKKFWDQLILFTSLKLNNLDLYLKYYKFYIKTKIKNITYNRVKQRLVYLFNNQFNNNFYKDDKSDYFLLAISSWNLNYKKKQCKKAFYNDKDNYRSCVRFVTYMLANEKNKYCEKIDWDYYKKWCFDTLKLLKNGK